MTKAQQASSILIDSGVLVRQAETSLWKRLGSKIQMISSARVDPSDPDTIFFACGNGIVRARDGGDNWRLVTGWCESDALQIAIDPMGLPEYFSKGIVIDHQRPKRLLLATTTGLFESKNQTKSRKRVTSFPKIAALRLRQSESDPNLWIAALGHPPSKKEHSTVTTAEATGRTLTSMALMSSTWASSPRESLDRYKNVQIWSSGAMILGVLNRVGMLIKYPIVLVVEIKETKQQWKISHKRYPGYGSGMTSVTRTTRL